MPSPFPVMDPYLEQHWRDVHTSLIVYARNQLQPELPSDLRARVEERVLVESPATEIRGVFPDVRIFEMGRAATTTAPAPAGTATAPLAIEVKDEPRTETPSILHDGVSLVIVDLQAATALVPGGFHELISRAYGEEPPARPTDRPLEAVSYEVIGAHTVRSHVLPLACGDALPEMPVFLKPKRFVRVPLERTYMEAFQGLAAQFRRVLEAS